MKQIGEPRFGEPRYEWAFERDETGLVVRMRAVEITEDMAAEERAEIEARQRARRPVMVDLVPWLEARGGKL